MLMNCSFVFACLYTDGKKCMRGRAELLEL